MHREKIERLVDPEDGSALKLEDVVEDETGVTSATLVGTSSRRYRVVKGVPRFVDGDQYATSFSFEWLTHARTQFDDARNDESMRMFLLKTGFDAPLLRGARVLDAGVGTGRFADAALRLGAAEVLGIDLSLAVESAAANLGRDSRFGVVQGSVFAPPFPDESFDLVYSIGVLHHTPAPQIAFERLVRLVRPGGRIAIYVYPDQPTHVVSDAIRRVTTRMEPEKLHRVVSSVQPLIDRAARNSLGNALLRWLPRSDHPEASWRVLDTFDWYSPRYQYRYRDHQEVCGWFSRAGLVDIRPLQFDICVQGRKPS